MLFAVSEPNLWFFLSVLAVCGTFAWVAERRRPQPPQLAPAFGLPPVPATLNLYDPEGSDVEE